jgi:hypothetical protein
MTRTIPSDWLAWDSERTCDKIIASIVFHSLKTETGVYETDLGEQKGDQQASNERC